MWLLHHINRWETAKKMLEGECKIINMKFMKVGFHE